MSTITFDTYQFIRTLKDSGLPEKQAEAITAAFQTAHGQAEVATQFDVELLRKDIKESELRLESRISESKAELTRWVISAGVLQTALIAGLLLKLMK
jgi:hypothetical protein